MNRLEEIVIAYRAPTRTQTHAMQVLCETTGETGPVRLFAERIAAARKSSLGSERSRIYRSIVLDTHYRGLKFRRVA